MSVHFLLSKRWVLRHVLAVVVVVTCLSLGVWQFQRLQERKGDNARLTSQTRLPETGLEVLLASVDDEADAAFRRVVVEGTYDVGNEVVLQSRSFNDRSGNHLLTPLKSSSGAAIVVDRGWVPIEINQPGAAEALPPGGDVELTGVLLPSEDKGLLGVSDPPPGTVKAMPRLDLERLQKQLPYPVAGLYLRLEEQNPPEGELPKPVPLPPLDEGPHFEYAVQWGFFALASLVIYLSLIRKEARRNRAPDEAIEDAPTG